MSAANGFPMPKSIVVDEAVVTENYAKFIASPFQSGFGHTLGNSLRRVLLSSLEGAAICSVRIDGAKHEFDAVDNVIEDVAELVLNLKCVRLNLHAEGPKTLEIRKDKAGKVTAADIVCDETQLGLAGSPTKVKKIENVVFQSKEAKCLTSSDEDVNSLMVELIASHTLG